MGKTWKVCSHSNAFGDSKKECCHEGERKQTSVCQSSVLACTCMYSCAAELKAGHIAGAINIIKDHGLGGTGEEIELDFDALDNDTLWALDDYMVQIKGGKPDSTGKANSGFQVEPESEYESDDSDVSE